MGELLAEGIESGAETGGEFFNDAHEKRAAARNPAQGKRVW
jgi:hypothetical protein